MQRRVVVLVSTLLYPIGLDVDGHHVGCVSDTVSDGHGSIALLLCGARVINQHAR